MIFLNCGRESSAKSLKKLIIDLVGNQICFSPSIGLHGSPLVVHASDVIPVDCALASIVGCGLRDSEITLAFAQMVHRKLKANETKQEFPISIEKLIDQLDSYEPMKELFNAIALSTNPSMKINTEGYACPDSEVRATEIWSIASDWQRLIIGGDSPKSIALSMIIHRRTGSKESINLLARSGAGITYTDVMSQSKTFAEGAKNDSNVAPNSIPKGQPTHVTIDNSDGRQQTITGLSTTHHTNSTIYVPRLVTNFDINYTHSEKQGPHIYG